MHYKKLIFLSLQPLRCSMWIFSEGQILSRMCSPMVWPVPAMDKQILAGPLAFVSVPPELWLRAGRVSQVQPRCCEQQHCLEPPAFRAARSCLRGDTHGHVPWHVLHGRELLAPQRDRTPLLAFSSQCLSVQLGVPAAASWTVPVLKDLFYISWGLLSSLRVTPWLFSCRGMVAFLSVSC